MNNHARWAVPFVDQLTKLASPDDPDRASMAHLRRGLCAPPDYTLSRVGWLFRDAQDDPEDHALESAILVAGLFAWVKGACPQNTGANFGRAFGHDLSDDDKRQREKRFTGLLDTDIEDLPYKLRQAVTLIARDKVGLDWATLIHHLINWAHPDRWVQKQWARAYWSTPRVKVAASDEITTAN